MKITVILTSYNHEKFINESIDSILNQTYQDFEFIIVDDCSVDSSWDIICEYKRKHPQIIAIRHKYNMGGESVMDTVKNYATGDYIALHHSDDLWERDKLQKQIATLQENPDCAAVFTNAQIIDDDGKPYADERGFYYNLFTSQNRSRFEWLNYFFYQGNCLCHPSILVKKSVYEDDGFFRKGLCQIPDLVKWIQICKKYDIFVMPDQLVKFRIRNEGKNTSGMRAETQIRSTVELFLMLQEYVDISDKEEFLKIFPKAEKYCYGNYFSTEYVLGRICTEEGMPPYTRLFGIQLLYKVLNQPDVAKQIEDEYGFTKKKFILENGQHDIFGVLPEAYEQLRSIYFDVGDGFSPENSISEKYCLNEQENFKMSAKIAVPTGKKLAALRFDPAEGVMVAAKLSKVTANGQVLENYNAENAFDYSVGRDIFLNLDPIYSITVPESLQDVVEVEIILEGTIERLTSDYIGEIATKVLYGNREEISTNKALYQGALKDYEQVLQILERERTETQKLWEVLENNKIERDMLRDEISSSKSLYQYALKDYEQVCEILSRERRETKEFWEEKQKEHEARLLELQQELEMIKSTRWYRAWVKLSSLRNNVDTK